MGVKRNFNNEIDPIYGEAIPFYMFQLYGEMQWNEKWRSSVGYSYFDNKTFDTQLSTSFKNGAYATANVVYNPLPNFSIGLEYQYGNRQNNDFGGDSELDLPAEQGNYFEVNKIQAMLAYKFSTKK